MRKLKRENWLGSSLSWLLKMSLKPLPAEKIIHALKKIGFEIVRQKGSHVILKSLK